LLTAQSAPKRIDWVGDLRFFEAEFPEAHVDAFHTLKRDHFHQMVSSLIASAPESADRQVVAGLMRITAAIGDSIAASTPFPQTSGLQSYPSASMYLVIS
jgi:hypothetical protein